jgi:drug/metabolite transporter (DMT)-like permease
MHVWRAAIGVTGLGLCFLANHLMPLADAVAITFAAPLIVTALSAPLLGERVELHRWGAVVAGFAGVLLIVKPSGEMFNIGAFVAVAAAFSMALTQITIRQLNRTDAPITIVIYFTLFSTLFTALPLPFVWITPTLEDWGVALLMGLFGGSAQFFVTTAFGLAPASVISPFNYAGLLWSGLLGWLIWSDIPEWHVFLGAAAVLASGLAIMHHETRKTATSEIGRGN